MYRESAKGWMKHIDFIAIDLICLQVAFCIAYVIRHGFANPYAQPLYRNMAFVLLLIDSAVIFFGNAYSNATRRGLIKEAGLPLTLSEAGVGKEKFEEIADNMTNGGSHTCGAFYAFTRDDILTLLEMMA